VTITVFPAERAAKRAHLLAAVERIRDVVAAGAEEAERLRTRRPPPCGPWWTPGSSP
jgi:hypothetical protein